MSGDFRAAPWDEGPADLRLVPPALAAWAGAALALGVAGWWTVAGVLLCLAGAVLLLIPAARRGLRATAVAGVLLCAAAGAASAGLHAADLHRGPLPALARDGDRVVAEVEVTSDPRLTSPRVRGSRAAPVSVIVEGKATRVEERDGAAHRTRAPVLLVVPAGEEREAWLRLLPSTRLRVSGRLAVPARAGDPFAAVLRADSAGEPRIIGPPSTLQRTAGGLRAGLRQATADLAPDARALLPGLVVGDTSRIEADLKAAFEATDLTHLLAVSGSNLTIVLLLLIGRPGTAQLAERGGLAPRLGIPLRATAFAGGGLTLAFVVVCRPDPSVLRAAACGLVTLLAVATGRRRSLIPALAAVVLVLVLYDPWLARSYGFLLSVLATGALLTVAPRWSEALQRRRVPGRIAEALAATLAAQAVCAPVVAVFAARVSLVAVPANLLAEPAVAPATVLGFLTLALAAVWPGAAQAVAWLAGLPAGWIAGVARTGAELPGAETSWPDGWWGGLLLALLTGLAVLAVRGLPWRRWIGVACAAVLLLAVVRPPPLVRLVSGWPPPGWVFAMCQVGQGDATVLAAGGDAAVVVDAGPDPVAVDRCLRDLGVRRIPLLVLTHFHADHVVGLPGVLRGRSVGAIQTTGLEEPRGQAAFVRRTARAAGVPVVRAVAGERRRVGPLEWSVLWPRSGEGGRSGGPGSAGESGANDASVTLFVRAAGGVSLLLLGDLEPPAQQGLLRAYPALRPVDVLKVAHHGSAHQDPGLIRAVRPRFALVSAGRDNPYGHPSPMTVRSLRLGGARVLSTDRDGAIAVSGAGSGLVAHTFAVDAG
ncbi:ComEC/Rec2 family competence protein [Streptomyces roseicoloratus]|uniref:ComEC/Rec2 family competence protein n=1 Tax=Streptomyces roseicoloratus TaxID=2508722 RepID=A0ABY9RZJ7_9ACTN|nr:ComEC/Rec2 family competence protein [Streptomyces roseicoloratus]WMX47138.1 ComEC/Rec2 family competence protein [Streptomyces roseicoloratus]